ncbi:MAG: UDP-N-acetylmuramoyl-tripeptide--D-alanyl-D-alanine ligase [Myxococcota bacterium]
MAVRFSDDQVIKALGAKRLRIGARASYVSVSTDTRQLAPGSLFVALVGERYDAHDFLPQAAQKGAAGAVVQKGKALPALPNDFALFEVEDTLRALGGLARFHRLRFQLPVGAITGSNGKTTTKEMAAAILATRGPVLKTEGNLNNEVGVPLTLFGLIPSQVGAVVEMGMNSPGEIARLTEIAQPDAGLVTVIQPAHLHGLGSIEGVAAAKGELFFGLRKGAVAVVNVDDPRAVAQAAKSGARALTFGRADSAEVQLVRIEPKGREGMSVAIRYQGEERTIRLGFVGEHNALNAAGAFALAIALGWSAEECVRGLESAKPHQRRLNVLKASGGVTVLDDCYNANPASMAAALQTLAGLSKEGRAVAVLGDMLELGPEEAAEHRVLGKKAAEVAKLLAFFGARSAEGHQAASLGEAAAHFAEVEPLVAWLRERLRPGDVVLVKGSRGMKLERVVSALTGQMEEGH